MTTPSKRVVIASDHAGFELKEKLIKQNPQVAWLDLGTKSTESVDYPDYADRLAQELKSPDGRGVLICGSGQGMAIRANRHLHIRAALCWSEEVARLSREHNDANVLCLGSRLIDANLAQKIFLEFMSTPFAGGRHQLRVDKLQRGIQQ